MISWLICWVGDNAIECFNIRIIDVDILYNKLNWNFEGELRNSSGYRITLHPQILGDDIATIWTLRPYNEAHMQTILEFIKTDRDSTFCIRKNLDSIPEWIYKQTASSSNYYIKTYNDRMIHNFGRNIIEIDETSVKTSWCCYKY